MNNLGAVINFLAQTAQERNLTILYLCLFVLVIGMLVFDTFAMKKWTPKAVHILLYVLLVAALVGLIILVVTAKRG